MPDLTVERCWCCKKVWEAAQYYENGTDPECDWIEEFSDEPLGDDEKKCPKCGDELRVYSWGA